MIRTMVLACVGALLCASCGGDPAPLPFIVQINSVDVVQTAVRDVELVFTPQALDQRFEMAPERLFGGGVRTRVSTAGEYVIWLDQSYIDAHAHPAGTTFGFEVPLYSTSPAAPMAIVDPQLRVTFLRLGERIAQAGTLLQWPLPPGERSIIQVRCNSLRFRRQCTNNDGMSVPDAGPPSDTGVPIDTGVDTGPPMDAGTDTGTPGDAAAAG